MAETTNTNSKSSVFDMFKGLKKLNNNIWLAIGVVVIITMLIIPMPSWLLDFGLTVSLSLSILILVTSIFLEKPLQFNSFPTVLLVSTMIRLSLNLSSTRLILTHGQEGVSAAGHVIEGFSTFIMGGNFVIGIVVFAILMVC